MVEDHILNTTHAMVNRAYIDELWDSALGKIVAVLRTHIVRQAASVLCMEKIESYGSEIFILWNPRV